ncbi:hypothetical protein LTR78_010110 [Recurvomyces mirabilis]|uniref:Uncharacterized protein n=1 Tax=Recurvomyces mirabilis TaxID=574656 RepID=A0AAE0WF67_9PEZI|nr:hypothetical protein LTR78_010110 [Recurvomyces mirabilis]KAK5150065.1 hypothetical protein LTS14_010430 [Recurvomyces mirabilis]
MDKLGEWPAESQQHEPRAVLLLNRFTRTSTIMYATGGLEDVIGIPAEAMRGRSFYCCIAENCLYDAVTCLENAKYNDSIAYLRFWFRDPRPSHPQSSTDLTDDGDEETTTDMSEDHKEASAQSRGGAELHREQWIGSHTARPSSSDRIEMIAMDEESNLKSRTSPGDNTREADKYEARFDQSRAAELSSSSLAVSPERDRASPQRAQAEAVELEAVISSTSDGLVVCLRRARPLIPHPTHRTSNPVYENGLFAAPWAGEAILPLLDSRPYAGFGSGFAPALGHRPHNKIAPTHASGPDRTDLMNAIKDQAIFAWGLVGMNESLAEYSQGKPLGESLPGCM